jgi:hypothetical protein
MNQEYKASPLAPFLDLTAMDDDETAQILQEAGMLIIESAVTRFVVEADDEEVQALQTILESETDALAALPKLIEYVPRFGDILNEEVAAFKMKAGELV